MCTRKQSKLRDRSGDFTNYGSFNLYNIFVTGGTIGETYDFVNYGGTTTFTNTSFTAEGDDGTFAVGNGKLLFTVPNVPEPSARTLFLMAGLLLGGSFRLRALHR